MSDDREPPAAPHRNAIALDDGPTLTDASVEVARVWITDGAGSAVWIDARVLEDPEVFGFLLADTIRHAARAYAATWDMAEAEALHAIVSGVSAELREEASAIATTRNGSLN